MKPQITVQLYSVRDNAKENYKTTIEAIAKMGFKYVEPAGYPGSSPEEASKIFNDLGIKAPTCHGGLAMGDDKNKIIDEYLTMGHKYVYTGCPPGFAEHYKSVDNLKRMCEIYCEAEELYAKNGLQLGYHNHDWDLVKIDGKPGYQIFMENTPETILYQADLYWVTKAGLNPADFIKEIGVRGKALHFKDGIISSEDEFTETETDEGKIMISNSKPFLPAGAGQVHLIDAAKAITCTEYIAVELDSYEGDIMKAVEESYKWITSNGIAE